MVGAVILVPTNSGASFASQTGRVSKRFLSTSPVQLAKGKDKAALKNHNFPLSLLQLTSNLTYSVLTFLTPRKITVF